IMAAGLPTAFDASNLPTGLVFDPLLATISGTPSSAGIFYAIISASNSSGTDIQTLIFNIAPAIQVISGLPATNTKIYGDAAYSPGALASSGLAVSYTSSNTSVAIILNNSVVIVGQGTTVITASQAGNGDYYAAASIVQDLTVNKKALSVTGTTISSKVYDASAISGNILVGAISGLVGNETVIATATGLYIDANAGNGKPASIVYALTDGANGGLAANYSLADEIIAGDIIPKPITITGTSIAPKVYDGSAITGLITTGMISGFIGTETLVVTGKGLFSDPNAGLNKTATVTYILADGTNGGLAKNYILADEILTGNIIPKELMVSGSTIAPKEYDGSAASGKVTVGTLSGFIGAENINATGNGLFADPNTGTNKAAMVTYTVADGTNGGLAVNYRLAPEVLNGDITPTQLTISGTTIAPKVYDASAFASQVSPGTVSGIVANQTLVITASGVYADANAGNGKTVVITYNIANGANNGLASNYVLANDTLRGDILPKELSVSGTTIAPKVYDGSALTGAITIGTIAGFIGSETVVATASGFYSNANAAMDKTATVTYTLRNGINGGLATNYSLPNQMITGVVTPAPLVIKVLVDTTKCSAESITFDNTNYTVTGLIQNEKIASLSLSPAGSPADDPVGVGVHQYYIGANTPVALDTTSPTIFIPRNYNITVDSGKLTINKSPRLVLHTDTICSGADFIVTPTNTNGNDFSEGTTYSWSRPSGTGFTGGIPGTNQNSISGKLTNISENNIVSATYRILPITGDCAGDSFTLVVVVKHLPSKPQIANIPATLQLCQNSNQNFTASIASTYSNASTNDVVFTWSTDASLIATSSAKPKGKNAIIQFPGGGPYKVKIVDSVLETNGCANDNTITVAPLGPAGGTPNAIIYNGINFVCLNNNVNAGIDGYQWGYDTKELVSNNYTTSEASFVTAQNLTRPISDTVSRYVWVLTRSGSCFTKTYFNPPHGRAGTIRLIPFASASAINIYPNPVTNQAIITWQYAYATDVAEITVTDITGRRISLKSIPAGITPGRAIINVNGLPGGIYLVNIRLNNKPAAVGKFVKK
ncbi:MAG: YDG domain-containing protein, partial [Ferruginibacter sp.]